jgi:molybdopterin-guanine dinucleotide biosynthesis protein A
VNTPFSIGGRKAHPVTVQIVPSAPKEVVMLSPIGRSMSALLVPAALVLLLSAQQAQAQCRAGSQQRSSPQQTSKLTALMQQQQAAQLTALLQQQQAAQLTALLQQQQTAALTAMQQQQLKALLAAVQLQNAMLTAQQQAAVAAQLTAALTTGSK